MNKSELIQLLAKQVDLPLRKSEEIVDKIFDTMGKALSGGQRIEIRGFGSFVVRDYSGYTGRNPKTGDVISVNGKKLPFFKVGKDFKERVDGPPDPEE